jgi:hypothetical protein
MANGYVLGQVGTSQVMATIILRGIVSPDCLICHIGTCLLGFKTTVASPFLLIVLHVSVLVIAKVILHGNDSHN